MRADQYPHKFLNVTMKRDQIIGFYRWLIEEEALGSRANLLSTSPDKNLLALWIENWQGVSPDGHAKMSVGFTSASDAVLFKLKFLDHAVE